MDSRIELIQIQLWLLIGLFAIFIAVNVVCYLGNRRRKNSKTAPQFEDMWERGNLEELDAAAARYLREYPNNFSARFFLAKSLASQGRNEEALSHLRRVATTEPAMEKMVKKIIGALSERVGGS